MPGVVMNCLQSPHLGRRVGRTRCSRSHSAKVRLRTAWVMGVLVPTSHHKTNKQTKLTRAAEMAQQVKSVCCANLIPWVWSLNALAGRNQFLRSILRPPHMRYGTCAPAPTQTRVPNKNKIKYICVYVCVFVCIKTTRMVKALATANSQSCPLTSYALSHPCVCMYMCTHAHIYIKYDFYYYLKDSRYSLIVVYICLAYEGPGFQYTWPPKPPKKTRFTSMQNCLRKKTEIYIQSQITNSYRKKIFENSHKELISLSLKGSWDLMSTEAGHQTKATGPRHATSLKQAMKSQGRSWLTMKDYFSPTSSAKSRKSGWSWWHRSVLPATRRLQQRPEDWNFKASRATEQAQGPAWAT